MIWELAHNAAMCMERIIVLLSWLITVDVGLYAIVECPGATVAFRGHPCPVNFDS